MPPSTNIQAGSVIGGRPWGVERGYLASNPAFKVKAIRRPRNAPQANRPWTDAEREAVLAAAPPHVRLPIALMMFTGMDPQDAVRLPRLAITEGHVEIQRGKTGVPVKLRILGQLATCLAAAPDHNALTVCANSFGRPWTVSGLRASWRKCRMELEEKELVEPNLTLKGLRHTVAKIHAEMGLDDRTIADVLGRKTLAMAQHYSGRADRSRKLAGVVKDFDTEVNRRRTKIVKPGD